MPKQRYDSQGMYFHHLSKLAGWDEYRVQQLLLKHFSASHWMALSQEQKRAAIAMMTRYANGTLDSSGSDVAPTSGGSASAVEIDATQLRGSITRTVHALKYNMDWLYLQLYEWGFPSKLHDCSHEQLVDIQTRVRALGKPFYNAAKTSGRNRTKHTASGRRS